MAGGRPTDYKEEYCEELIIHMSMGYSFESFAGIVGTCKQTLYNWLESNPMFLDAKEKGFSASRLRWEQIGLGIAQKGQGNATAFIFNMKNRFPSEWRDKQELDHSTQGEKIQAVQFVVKAQDGSDNSE